MRTSTARVALIIALFGILTVPAAAQSPASAPFDVVKAPHPEMRRLIADAHTRSATFRDLVDKIRASGWVVFVQAGLCPETTALGCLTDYVGIYEGSRYVRAIVNYQGRHPDNVMATIAHELQHAVEVVLAPNVVDSRDLRELFRTIGRQGVRWYSGTTYDTVEARVVEGKVRRELDADRKRARETR